jgi:hypothetical protein
MCTWTCIVHPVRGWIPVRAWMWLATIRWIADTLLIEHRFDAEEAFAVFFVSVDEELVTMEALAVLAALGDLRRRQEDCGRWFVDGGQ